MKSFFSLCLFLCSPSFAMIQVEFRTHQKQTMLIKNEVVEKSAVPILTYYVDDRKMKSQVLTAKLAKKIEEDFRTIVNLRKNEISSHLICTQKMRVVTSKSNRNFCLDLASQATLKELSKWQKNNFRILEIEL